MKLNPIAAHDDADADQRQRHGHDGNDHGAERAEEQEDDDDDDADRQTERALDFRNRRPDELGGIVGDRHFDSRRQALLDLRQDRPHVVDDVERIAGRRRVDADEHRAVAVHQHRDVGALRAEIDVGDVLQPHQRAVLGLHHHVPEFVDRLEVGVGDDVGDGEVTFGLARRRLIVVGQKRARDIDRGNAARRHARRIEPHPHRISLAAENVGRRDAIDSRQQRLDVAREIVGDRRGAQLV